MTMQVETGKTVFDLLVCSVLCALAHMQMLSGASLVVNCIGYDYIVVIVRKIYYTYIICTPLSDMHF